jgi:hypothetical protein
MTLSDMAANAESAQKGKLPARQIEHLLREIEENNLDRELLLQRPKQLWKKKTKFYGDPPLPKAENRLEDSLPTL